MIKTRDDFPKFFEEMGYKQGVEVGVLKGEFSEHILKNWSGHLYMVDCWEQQPDEVYFDIANQPNNIQEQYFHQAVAVASKYPGRYTIMRMYSESAARTLARNSVSLDFVYLDANHSYEATSFDIKLWYPLITDGGTLAGHDFLDAENNCGSRFGVKSAVTEFVEKAGQELFIVQDPWPSWYIIKEVKDGQVVK